MSLGTEGSWHTDAAVFGGAVRPASRFILSYSSCRNGEPCVTDFRATGGSAASPSTAPAWSYAAPLLGDFPVCPVHVSCTLFGLCIQVAPSSFILSQSRPPLDSANTLERRTPVKIYYGILLRELR